MKRSLNEVSAMVTKAARGAGVPLGHCEDLAIAAAYLAATDPASLTCLVEVLDGPFSAPVVKTTGTALRLEHAQVVMAAPMVLDALRADLTEVVLVDVQAAQIIFALCAAHGVGVSHKFEGTALTITPNGNVPQRPHVAPVTVPQALWNQLATYAALTYVPATEASRFAGAGAGLTDND